MIKSKKQMFLVIGVFVLVMMLSAVTYAFFNYTRTGVSNTIKVGRISFVTRELDTINLTNVFPISSSEATGENPNYGEVVIEIVGDTDYTGGIEYLVSAVDANIYTNQGQVVPISLDIKIDDNLGTENNNYFTVREDTNTSIYKRIVGDTLVGDQMLLVGYIAPNNVSGTPDGIDATITIKTYLDKDKILISDTYDGTESDNMGTTNSMAEGKTVITTPEWNALQSSGVSFKVKVEANEGIWVNGSLEEIMRKSAVMDNINSDYVNNDTPGVNFGEVSGDTNGKGVYMRAGTESDDFPIVYYRGEVEDNNILFNNNCWKAVRTTETGGVKLIYNGKVNNIMQGVALDDYNIITNTNDMFSYDNTTTKWTGTSTSSETAEFEFTVPSGDSYIFDVEVRTASGNGGALTITKNDSTVYTTSGGGGMILSYTYNAGTLTSNDTIKFSFAAGNPSESNPLIYIFQMYKSTSPILEKRCDNQKSDSQITLNVNGTDKNTFEYNLNSNSPAYVGYMYGTVYEYSTENWTSGAKFGSGFTWDGTNYKLVNATYSSPDSTHHYSCNFVDADATCTDLRYVYYVSGSKKYYITLTAGDGIEEALLKMQTNTNDSNAKEKIETWYASNMTNVTNKLEDTVWCNDRTFGGGVNINGWIANGGSTIVDLQYAPAARPYLTNEPSLVCINKNDSFTWKDGNGNQKLEYPVGLLTSDEIMLAGENIGDDTSFYLASGEKYWTMSPYSFDRTESKVFGVYSFGNLNGVYTSTSYGLRPAISIKPGQLIIKGTGTVADPYVIE